MALKQWRSLSGSMQPFAPHKTINFLKRIFFTVTNELVYDQRMIRICSTLAREGYAVSLVGRSYKQAAGLQDHPFRQVRIPCFARRGKWMYIEFNIKLFFFLLFKKMDAVCAIDLDTILPVWLVAGLRNKHRVYDAHELFCEMKEVRTRRGIYRFWKRIERFAVPRFKWGYTVNAPIAAAFKRMYGVEYEIIRNISVLESTPGTISEKEDFIIYQGAVNEGRSFETLIPAMQYIDSKLMIYGDGNFMQQARTLIQKYNLGKKVILAGKAKPNDLKTITPRASIGITLFDRDGASNYYSLANRFFDYIHAGIPQLCVDYPVYREINEQFEVAVLISDLSPENIARKILVLLNDKNLYHRLRQSCLAAREVFNWQQEEKKLTAFYRQLFQ